MKKSWTVSLVLFFLIAASASFSQESDYFSSNWGFTGLLEIPDARVMEKHMWRPHVRQVHPYRFYSISITPFDGVEITGRVTEILGVKAPRDPIWKGYGNVKDKAMDIKLRLIREGKYLPQISLGIMDPHGTRLYPSQYIVMSKKIHPFDLTVGFGNGRFGKRPISSKGEGFYLELFQDPKKWLDDGQFFYGVRVSATEKLTFIAEYDPTRYKRQVYDPARRRYFDRTPGSRINLGLSYKPFTWMDLTFAYERGNTFGFGISMPFRIGEPLLPIFDTPYKEPERQRLKQPEERLADCLIALGFREVRVAFKGNRAEIDAENRRYFYLPQAIQALVKYASPIFPEEVEEVGILFRENGIPVFSFDAKKEDMLYHAKGEIDLRDFLSLCNFREPRSFPSEKPLPPTFSYGYKPQIAFYLNDPSGFWKGKAGLVGWFEYRLSDLLKFNLGVSAYPLSNVSSTVGPLSIPVRSDIAEYLKRRAWLDRFSASLIGKSEDGFYYRLSAGMLEFQYGGLDGEIAKPYFDGRFLLGLSGSLVKKRAKDNPFTFKRDDIKTYYNPFFANLRLNLPELDMFADLKVGRFLAGDYGTRITISKYIKGVRISGWVGLSNTSVFKDQFNRGYKDKGISVHIPMRLLEGRESRTVAVYSVSPWTRDVAQDIEHPESLFEILGRNFKKFLDRDLEIVYEK